MVRTNVTKAQLPRRTPRVVYVSYDGAGEPLGQSQIVAYLERLTSDVDIELVSFEKPDCDLDATGARLARSGISWTPLRYHGWPPALSTAWDLAVGAARVDRAVRRDGGAGVVHVRSDVPGLMARCSPAARRAKLLFDIRGFWADERVDAGIWPRGVLYRAAKRQEQRLFTAADAIVTLTEASVPQIEQWLGHRRTPIHVIPTCADVDRYGSTTARVDGPHAVWSGSISTWYRFDLALRLTRALARPLTVLTREFGIARAQIAGAHLPSASPTTISTVAPAQMPIALHFQDIGLCLIRASFSKTASAPTRFAEFLAAGMPVAVSAGVGDLDAIVERNDVGVVLRAETDAAIASAASTLLAMAADPKTCERCRELAREQFDVREGARRYADAYAQLLAR